MKRCMIQAKKSQAWVRIPFYSSHNIFLYIFLKRRSLKLSIQLISISMLYLISWMPYAILGLLQIFENIVFLTYLPYCPVLFSPFICLLSMPNIKTH